MTEAEQALINDLNAVKAQQEKTSGEITALKESSNTFQATIATLEAELAAMGTAGPSQGLIDAVAAVKAQAQHNDDLITDLAAPV